LPRAALAVAARRVRSLDKWRIHTAVSRAKRSNEANRSQVIEIIEELALRERRCG